MTASSGSVRDEAWLRHQRSRIARELHPDLGGSHEVYLAAVSHLERLSGEPAGAGTAPVEVRTTLRGRLGRGRRRLATAITSVERGTSRGVAVGRRLVGRPPRPPRVR